MMDRVDEEIVLELFDFRLVQISPQGKGKWRFKIHDTRPDAPFAPHYTNLRGIRSYPKLHDRIATLYAKMVEQNAAKIERARGVLSIIRRLVDVPLAITPTVGLVSVKTGIPMLSPRFDVRTHGLGRNFDGVWDLGDRVAIIDDIRTTGGSKEEIMRLCLANALVPVAVFVLIDYDERNPLILDVPVIARWQWQEVLDVFRRHGRMSPKEYESSLTYHTRLKAYIDAHK